MAIGFQIRDKNNTLKIVCIIYSPARERKRNFSILLQRMISLSILFTLITWVRWRKQLMVRNTFKLQYITKYCIKILCKSVDEQKCLKQVESYFRSYRRPKRLISVRCAAFTFKTFEEIMNDWQVEHVKVATCAPRANEQIERVNGIIIPTLVKISCVSDRWDKILNEVHH